MPADDVLSDLAGLPALKPEGAHPAMAGEDCAVHGSEEADLAMDSVAGMPAAPAAGTRADVEILQDHGKAQLENIRIGQPRIGRVGMDGIRAVEARFSRGGRAWQVAA